MLLVCRVRPFSGGGSGSVRSGPSTWRPVPRGCERLSSEGESDGRQWPPGPGAPQAGGCQRGGRGGSGLLRGLTLDWAAWPGCPPCGEPPQSRLPPVLFPGGRGPRSRASLEHLCGGDVPASGHVRRQPAPSPAWPEPHLTHFCFLSDFLDPVSKPFCSGDCAQVMTTNPKPNKALKVSGVGVGRPRFCLGLRLGKGPFRPPQPLFPRTALSVKREALSPAVGWGLLASRAVPGSWGQDWGLWPQEMWALASTGMASLGGSGRCGSLPARTCSSPAPRGGQRGLRPTVPPAGRVSTSALLLAGPGSDQARRAASPVPPSF